MRERDGVQNDSDDEDVTDDENDQDQDQEQDDVEVYLLPASIQERRLEGQRVRTNLMNGMRPRRALNM